VENSQDALLDDIDEDGKLRILFRFQVTNWAYQEIPRFENYQLLSADFRVLLSNSTRMLPMNVDKPTCFRMYPHVPSINTITHDRRQQKLLIGTPLTLPITNDKNGEPHKHYVLRRCGGQDHRRGTSHLQISLHPVPSRLHVSNPHNTFKIQTHIHHHQHNTNSTFQRTYSPAQLIRQQTRRHAENIPGSLTKINHLCL
jgi:hypothetical protein